MQKIFILLMMFVLGACDNKPEYSLVTSKKLWHPLTDNTHVDVYTFIGQHLEGFTELLSAKEVENFYEEEKIKIGDNSLKPHIAGMHQTQVAGLLSVLLLQDDRYINVTLYSKDGVGTDTSDMRYNLDFGNQRPTPLSLGILTPEFLKGPLSYIYKIKGQTYKEEIRPIIKLRDEIYSTSVKEKGKFIGYMSFITLIS